MTNIILSDCPGGGRRKIVACHAQTPSIVYPDDHATVVTDLKPRALFPASSGGLAAPAQSRPKSLNRAGVS